MRAGLLQPLLFSQLLLLNAAVASAGESYSSNNLPATSGHSSDGLLVKFKPHISRQLARTIAESYGALEIFPLSTTHQAAPGSPMAQWHHLRFDQNANLQQIKQRLEQDASVEIVEFNQEVTIQKQ